MSLKDRVLKILKSNETRRINFSFTSDDGTTDITINYASFQKVASAVDSGKISLKEASSSIAQDIDASYTIDDTLSIDSKFVKAYGNSRLFDALIIHESVHAYFDIIGKKLLAIDSEAAGYIAQGYYLRNSGYSRNIQDPLMNLGRKCIDSKGAVSQNGVIALFTELEGDSRYVGLLFKNPNLPDESRYQAGNKTYFEGNK